MKLLIGILLALVFLGAVALYLNIDRVEQFFGPSSVVLEESYVETETAATFDHGLLDAVLKQFVKSGGWVDYEGLQQSSSDLDTYIASLGTVEFEALARDEKLALAINAYNAFTLRLILDHLPLESIQDIPAAQRWTAERWTLGGKTLSLQALEDDILRANFSDPRIHFAINCASVSCPPLRLEAYRGADIETQLQDQAEFAHSDPRWFELDSLGGKLQLTRLYLWYEGDFKQIAGTVLQFAARFSPALADFLSANTPPAIDWIKYDWSLNAVASHSR